MIERYRITHSQWVPTMLGRLLQLPEEVRHGYDLSSHRCAIHAAAPCPVAVKQALLDWWGDILLEYYAGSEGCGITLITQLYSQAIFSMNIGELEVRSGATRHTLRYYEKIGLISPLRRTNNYRVYTPQTLQDLDFIQRAQSMGFSLGEIGEILNAQRNKSIDCAGGARLIEKKMAEIKKKITDLKSIYRYLDAERANLEASAARQLELQQLNGSSN